MHLAYCKKFIKTGDEVLVEDISFFCADAQQSQLLSYLSRYQNYMRNIEPDCYYMICSTSDLGSSVSTTTIQGLGAVELTRQKLDDMKRNIVQNNRPLSEVIEAINSYKEEEKDEDILLGYNLKFDDKDPTLHNLVKKLIFNDILFYVEGTDTNPIWSLIEGKAGDTIYKQSEIEAPCYLVRHNNVFFLSKTVEKYTGDTQ